MSPPLPLITSLARAGALEQAWRLFRQGGYTERADDAAVLAVKGRLLKDSGLRLSGGDRQAKLAEAASAYASANALAPQPWLAINMATLTLLAGDVPASRTAAAQVLAQLDSGAPLAETAYWLGATRAEALLLLGREDEASAALEQARAASPENWTDQASTVRQLGLILAAQGGDGYWLDPHRPPRSLHFAGHLGVAPQAPALSASITDILVRENIGFGYGALAAGADIVIAEALLERGAELHVILPVGRDVFAEQSVLPYGADWEARYLACLDAAHSVQEVTSVTGAYEPLATALAADLSMGAATLTARQLQSEAVQLLILDEGDGPDGGGAATARDGTAWGSAGRRQYRLRAPRLAPVAASAGKVEGRPDRRLHALLTFRFQGLETLSDGDYATELDTWLSNALSRLRALAPESARIVPMANGLLIAFDRPMGALDMLRAARALDVPGRFPLTIVGHYALLHDVNGQLVGPALTRLEGIATAALPGTTMVSSPFAMALAINPANAISMEPQGDLEGQPLYTLQ